MAVIGDGALSGGMAYEALNNLALFRKEKKNIIIILNDNKMSISENVGGMSRYLNDIRSGKVMVSSRTMWSRPSRIFQVWGTVW